MASPGKRDGSSYRRSGYGRAAFRVLLAIVVVLISAGGASARKRAVPPLHPLSNYEYGFDHPHAKIRVQLVTTWAGRGIYDLHLSTRCDLNPVNPFIVQSEEIGAQVEPIGPTGLFNFTDAYSLGPKEIVGLVSGRVLNRNTIGLNFSIERGDTNCKVVRYPRGSRYGIKLRYTGPFQ